MRHIMLFLLFSLSVSAFADWEIVTPNSDISFESVKNGSFKEVHRFDKFSGRLSDDGEAILDIDLDSVNTKIDIRNDRMRKMLFETDKFPKAMISAEIEMGDIERLKTDESIVIEQLMRLQLHGASERIEANLKVTKKEKGFLLVETVSPVMIDAVDYSLLKGIDALKTVAKLKSIKTSVPVSIRLLFKPLSS